MRQFAERMPALSEDAFAALSLGLDTPSPFGPSLEPPLETVVLPGPINSPTLSDGTRTQRQIPEQYDFSGRRWNIRGLDGEIIDMDQIDLLAELDAEDEEGDWLNDYYVPEPGA
jgi:hypothetical protein